MSGLLNILEDELIAAVCVTEHSHSSKNRSQLRDLRRDMQLWISSGKSKGMVYYQVGDFPVQMNLPVRVIFNRNSTA